jgi:hypothetical protein
MSGLTIVVWMPAMNESYQLAAFPALKLIRSDSGSTTVTVGEPAKNPALKLLVLPELMLRSRPVFTAFASKTVPSVNVTSGRTFTVIVLASTTSALSARSGVNVPSGILRINRP